MALFATDMGAYAFHDSSSMFSIYFCSSEILVVFKSGTLQIPMRVETAAARFEIAGAIASLMQERLVSYDALLICVEDAAAGASLSRAPSGLLATLKHRAQMGTYEPIPGEGSTVMLEALAAGTGRSVTFRTKPGLYRVYVGILDEAHLVVGYSEELLDRIHFIGWLPCPHDSLHLSRVEDACDHPLYGYRAAEGQRPRRILLLPDVTNACVDEDLGCVYLQRALTSPKTP